jgi:hypothetical protein
MYVCGGGCNYFTPQTLFKLQTQNSAMTFRAPLLNQNGDINSEVYRLLTDKQIAKLFEWAYIKNVTPKELLQASKYMVEQIGDSHEVALEGVHITSGLYGCIMPDGSVHT